MSGRRIIRPAYKSVSHRRAYVPLAEREEGQQPRAADLVVQTLSDADAIGD